MKHEGAFYNNAGQISYQRDQEKTLEDKRLDKRIPAKVSKDGGMKDGNDI